MKLTGKVIAITGASEGLGKELAIKLSKQKAKIALIARTEANLRKVKREIDKNKMVCEYFVCDVSDFNQSKKTAQMIEDKLGNIDVLINNAGVWYEGPTVKHGPEKVKELFATNSAGPIFMIQAVLPGMQKRNKGVIINVISDSGLHAGPNWSVYVASKYAAKGFTDSLREELKGQRIQVLGLYQGGMDTGFFNKAGFPKESQEQFMDPKEIADVIIFMLTRPENMDMKEVEVGRHK